MKNWKAKIMQYILMCTFSGFVYVTIEILYRGFSDVSMMYVASICVLPMIFLNNWFSYEMDFILQCLICAVFATGVELCAGLALNADYHIWDYRNMPGNICGQICPQFFLVWMLMAAWVIPLMDWIEYHLYQGGRPYYRIFGHTFWMSKRDSDDLVQKGGKNE